MPLFKNKILLVLLAIIVLIQCLVEATGRGDFFIFMSATGDIIRGQNFYLNKYVNGYHYFYSVLFALILKPFYYLSFYWVKFLWLLLNALAYFSMLYLLINCKELKLLNKKKQQWFIALVFIFSLRFYLDNIHTSQITILILWCCVYGLYYISNGKPIAGAAILALGINIKLMPIVFLPYLIYRGYFKAFIFSVIFYFVYLLAPAIFIGNDYNMVLLKTWLNLINPTNQNHVLDVEERSFHGLSTLLSTLFIKNVPDVYAMPLKRNIADVGIETLNKILLAVRLLLVIITLYFLKWPPFIKAKNNWQQFIEISYILLIIPLIFPHQQHYAFLFIVPAFAILLFYLTSNYNSISKNERITFYVFLILIYLATNLKLLLGEYNNYYDHYKILTYGALLLIPLLVWLYKRSKHTAITGS